MIEGAKERTEKTLSPLYNMGAYEFERWAEMLKEGTNLALLIRGKKVDFLPRFEALIFEIHGQWKYLFRNRYGNINWEEKFTSLIQKHKDLIKGKTTIQKSTTGKTSIISGYPELLIEIWETLNDFKFAANLSVPMTHQLTDEERFKRSL